MIRIFSIFFLFSFSLFGGKYETKLNVLYDSLDPNSISQLLAFYNLYGETPTGKKAFDRVWTLINLHRVYPVSPFEAFSFPTFQLESLSNLAIKQAFEEVPTLPNQALSEIEYIASHLGNRKLKGHAVWTKEELYDLSDEEIDVARALLIHQYGKEESLKIRSYESYLDLMALQILARVPKNPSDIELLEAINHFIFLEMCYRFPPHSMWAKDVDLYTFLPSVLDSRHGVCLGVSILYLSLAQRLNISLIPITPPGHIYLSYQKHGKLINIETTARGIHMPDETYLNINTCKLQRRSIKEVIGLNFMNAAATAWHKKDFSKAIELYSEAKPYLPKDRLLNIFMGFNYLFIGDLKQGRECLIKAVSSPSEEDVYEDTTIADFLDGKVGVDGIKVVYKEVDETRESILTKQAEIKQIVDKYPKFREGIFHLAITWLQLGRNKEAMEALDQYHNLDNENPTVEYYLSILSMQRMQYKKAYEHLSLCKAILKRHNHSPKALFSLEHELKKTSLPL
jgi:tetratricopeptide (TPR) repeat protein